MSWVLLEHLAEERARIRRVVLLEEQDSLPNTRVVVRRIAVHRLAQCAIRIVEELGVATTQVAHGSANRGQRFGGARRSSVVEVDETVEPADDAERPIVLAPPPGNPAGSQQSALGAGRDLRRQRRRTLRRFEWGSSVDDEQERALRVRYLPLRQERLAVRGAERGGNDAGPSTHR